ncbi:antibiotic biosynthesis monooxygenase family protein [Chloroflexota bacterium]
MIKVIEGYKLKVNADIQPVLMKLRSHAITYPGFISAENLVRTQDRSIIFVIYTWNRIEDWNLWDNTSVRKKILKEAEALLSEKPRVRIYGVMSTTTWSS